ncbi:MAG: MBL fold metallo-hydrolase [Candidatus Aminicenantes bacterium]|nr:MBL fold metallo-hydrolase [Candidatus Aminicenantes bacterium]
MKGKTRLLIVLGALSICFIGCSRSSQPVVVSQAVGPIKVNCYLLYDAKSREAALFDVGGPIDELVSEVNEKGLKLKYIFITHCHCDHVLGLPAARERFPEGKVCFSREEYEDMGLYERWEEKLPPQEVAEMKKALGPGGDPELAALLTLDYDRIGKPDIFVADGQVFKLGGLKIGAVLSPGHSRGSMCYSTPGILISGDVLFAGQVGRTDLMEGGREAIVKSVRNLYASFPDETKVYPGHGPSTDIGTEKKSNEEVTAISVTIKN